LCFIPPSSFIITAEKKKLFSVNVIPPCPNSSTRKKRGDRNNSKPVKTHIITDRKWREKKDEREEKRHLNVKK
jgi:hypothetical protein